MPARSRGIGAAHHAREERNMKPRILIVDDSDLNRDLLSCMLEDQYDILEAENGIQAIQILEKQCHELSVMLLDLMMPECDGYQVLGYMNRRHWIDDLPVVVISSETGHDFISRAYDLGATDFISRPFDSFIVKRRVKNTIALYDKQRRLAATVAEEIYERTKTYDLMLSILSQIVEFRNQESGLHVRNINLITELLLRQVMARTNRYGITMQDVRMISQASSFHDIGKISIPDEILNKPGKLTPEEFAVIKTHPAEGARMLEGTPEYEKVPLLRTAREICRWHHERYDGRGYPDGLVGDAIPLSAQVVSLADVYDALTSDRCYKKAFSHETAISMILGGQCGAFNPLLLECLLELGDSLPQALHADPALVREKRELEYLTEEISLHEELTASNQLISQFRFEQTRADFFEASAGDMTFVYHCDPPMLTLSDKAARLLDLHSTITDPVHDEAVLQLAGQSLPCWQDAQNQASPGHPDFALCFRLSNGSAFRCRCRSVWAFDGAPRCLGAVGTIQEDIPQ